MDGITTQTIDCAVQFFETFKKQASKGKRANFKEPCSNCKYVTNCDLDWAKHLSPLLTRSNVSVQLDCLYDSDQEDEKNAISKMLDRIFELQPQKNGYHNERVVMCEEVLKTLKEMKGTDLEPYLSNYNFTLEDGCFNLTFKFPLIPYDELVALRLRTGP